MSNLDYKAAYERQKQARVIAEELLESRSRELYEVNQSLQYAYNKLKGQKAQLIHQERLASIGQLAAGVAHEINNPTGYVKSNLNTLKNYSSDLFAFCEHVDNMLKSFCGGLPGGICSDESVALIKKFVSLKKQFDVEFLLSDIRDIVEESHEGIKRIETIVSGLKAFSRPDQVEMQAVNLIACIETTIKLIFNQVKHQMEIDFWYSDLMSVKGQHGSLSQVFLNLIVNASHAVTENGHLDIKALRNGDYAEITFSDNGCGMSQEVQQRIFDPFFSTKPEGEGTGLGLSISHGIIKKHGGVIEVESESGKGTIFIIKLPLE